MILASVRPPVSVDGRHQIRRLGGREKCEPPYLFVSECGDRYVPRDAKGSERVTGMREDASASRARLTSTLCGECSSLYSRHPGCLTS